jgi:hypothetical protein
MRVTRHAEQRIAERLAPLFDGDAAAAVTWAVDQVKQARADGRLSTTAPGWIRAKGTAHGGNRWIATAASFVEFDLSVLGGGVRHRRRNAHARRSSRRAWATSSRHSSRRPYLNRRPQSLLSLVSTSTTNSDKIEWVRQTSRPTSAAFVPEAVSAVTGAKPEGAAAWEVISADVVNVAEWIPVTRRAMRDAGRVEAMLNDELIYDLFLTLENSMQTGDGTNDTFLGIDNVSGINAYTIGTTDASENVMDAIHRAITLGRLDEEEPDGVLLNPLDWETIRLSKDDNGNYIYGPPSTAGDMQIFGKKVVMSNARAAGSALVGNFRRGAELSFAGGVETYVADQHADFFVRNILVLLAEVAAAFLVKRPQCFAVVDLEA